MHLHLINNTGRIIRSEQFALANKENNLQLNNTGNLPKGLHTIRIEYSDKTIISKKVIKQ